MSVEYRQALADDIASGRIKLPPCGAPSASESAGLLRPPLDVRPVPRRAATDDPTMIGKDAPLAPLVDGASLHVESGGYLGGADRVAGHGESVNNMLTSGKRCSNFVYMTEICTNTTMRHIIRLIAHNMRSAENCDEGGIAFDLGNLLTEAKNVAIRMGYDEMDVEDWANHSEAWL